jgi:HK97 family phage portal protein
MAHPILDRKEPTLSVPKVRAEITESMDLAGLLARLSAGGMSESGVPVSLSAAESLAAVHRAEQLISGHVAMLPLGLFRRKSDGNSELATDHPLYHLLHDQASEYQTSHQWRRLMNRDVEFRGNGISLIVWGVGRRPQELIRLHPDRVRVKVDDLGVPTYEYTKPNSQTVTYSRRDLLHVWFWSDDGYWGKSTIAHFRDTFGESLAMRQHSSGFFKRGAWPSGVLEVEKGARIGPDAAKDMAEDFDTLYAGGENAGKTVALPGGVKYSPITMSQKDAEYVASRKLGITDIARIFGTPPHKIYDLDRSTNNNIEHQSIEYYTDSLGTRLHGWEQCLNMDLLNGDRSLYTKFNERALLRGDAKSQNEALQIQRRNGVINANEWRELMDMNRRGDPGGDQYIVEGNMSLNDGRNPADRAGNPAPEE